MGLLNSIKEIGIFIIIAQCILHLVPGPSYTKYVKVLVGIMMIAKLAEPILSAVFGEEKVIWQEQANEFAEILENHNESLELEDNRVGIYDGIEEELKSRLNALPDTDYIVEKVELSGILSGEGAETSVGEEKLIVSVAMKNKSPEISNKTINQIEIEKITLSNNKKEEIPEDSEENKLQEQKLKEAFSQCTGIDESRIEILFSNKS